MAAMLGARLGTFHRRNASARNATSSLKLQLALSAENLIELNVKRSDALNYFCSVHMREESDQAGVGAHQSGDGQWKLLGKTDVVYDTANPKWPTIISIDYSFNVVQKLRFTISRFNPNDKSTQTLGIVERTVAHLIMADGHTAQEVIESTMNQLVSRRSNRGNRPIDPMRKPVLNIHTEEERGDIGDSISIQFALQGAPAKRPFYTISREVLNASGSGTDKFTTVLFSEVLRSYRRNEGNAFRPFTVALKQLCNNNLDRKLRLELSDYNRSGHHKSIATMDFTVNNLLAKKHDRKANKLTTTVNRFFGRKTITLQVMNIEVTTSYSFLDYIRAGVEFNLMVAVDMSSSNGNPRDRKSLQCNNRDVPNDYVVALREVGFVLAQYDTDKQIPAYGFGSVLPPEYAYLSFCFALSGDAKNPACNEIEGVVNKYYDALDVVAPHQPCYMNPVIQHCVEECKQLDSKSYHTTYTVLLIITDGVYQDQRRIADSIFEACDLPLSIVAVGVGKDETKFALLEELDGDENRLCNSQGVPASRDIVQFVPFEKHRHNPAALSAETLAEVPRQLLEYMRARGLRPDDITKIRQRLKNDESPDDILPDLDVPDILTSQDSDFTDLSARSSFENGPMGHTSIVEQQDLPMIKPPTEERPTIDNFTASTFKKKGEDFGIYVGKLGNSKNEPRSPTFQSIDSSFSDHKPEPIQKLSPKQPLEKSEPRSDNHLR